MDFTGFLLKLDNAETNTEAETSRPSSEEGSGEPGLEFVPREFVSNGRPAVVYRKNNVN